MLITGHLGPGRSKPKNGSTLCSQIHGVSLNCHSVIFTDTTSHTLKRFSLEASVLDGKKEVEKVDTIIGDGTSGAEDGFIDVARVTHPTGIVSERGTIFFVDTGSKTVRLMYTSADANDSTEEQALTSIQELFKAVSSERRQIHRCIHQVIATEVT